MEEEACRANQEYLQARDEMKDALVQKLSFKFGKSAPEKDYDQVSVASTAIRKEVDGMLVGAAARVTEKNLARLERRLQQQAHGKPVDSDVQSVQSISAYTTGSSMPRRFSGPRSGSLSHRESRPLTPANSVQTRSVRGSVRTSAQGSARGSGSGRLPIGSAGRACVGDSAYDKRASPSPSFASEAGKEKQPPQDVDWSTIDRLASKLHEKDAELQRARMKELQMRLKEDLVKQIADAKLKKARERENDQQFFDTHIAVHGSLQDQEQEAYRIKREKALSIQKERDRQVQSDRARKQKEKFLAKKEEAEMVQRVKKEDEQDRQQTEERRVLCRERMQKALQDSCTANAQRKQEEKNKMDREDARLEEYRKQKMELEKKSQEESWQKVVDRRQMLESAASTRYNTERQKQDETEAKAERERLAKEASSIENEKRKNDQLKEKRYETQSYNLEQMRLQTEGKEKAKNDKKNRGSAIEVDAQKYVDADVRRTAAQKQRALEHRAELERQIAAKMGGPKKDAMSSLELALNKKLVDRVGKELQLVEDRTQALCL